jgi:hypothetical protein
MNPRPVPVGRFDGPAGGWNLKRVLGIGIVVAGGTYLLLEVVSIWGLAASYPVVLATVIALIMVVLTTRRSEAEPIPTSIHETPWMTPSFPEADDGAETSIAQWSSRLEFGDQDVVRRTILDLIDERLRLSHGIIRAESPDRARALVGPQLWQFIAEPRPDHLSPRELTVLIERMESL